MDPTETSSQINGSLVHLTLIFLTHNGWTPQRGRFFSVPRIVLSRDVILKIIGQCFLLLLFNLNHRLIIFPLIFNYRETINYGLIFIFIS